MKRDILYVDDEPENVIVFEAAFEDAFNVLTASCGSEAIELLAGNPVPVIVTDQRMPEMTGTELLAILKQTHPHMKRIILTGHIDSAAMMSAINGGDVFYFATKPWDRDSLQAVLLRAIEAHDMMVTNSALMHRLVTADRCAVLGRSAAQVAHEMGNQLNILPLLELIEDEYSDREDLMTAAKFARQTHERLVGLVGEVKSFVRFEMDGQARHTLSVPDLVHELLDFLRYDDSLPLGRLAVAMNARPQIVANKVRLQQVLVNLLKNAAHATRGREDGQIWLTIGSTQNSAIITVKDNGHGMSQQTVQRIWEPFFTTKGEEGNGLGLDVAKMIIEGHGGTITCESAPGRGATFTVELPLAPCDTKPSALPLTGIELPSSLANPSLTL